MPARKRGAARPGTMPDSWKDKIQATMIAKRLQQHVFGEIELSATQIAAAKILLNKTIPDLASVAHTGANGGNIIVEIVR